MSDLAYSDPFRKRGLLTRVWDAIVGKQDGWINQTTGAGDISRDKMMQGFFGPIQTLDYGELESLYYGDDVCERIVDALPDEAFRRGYELEGPLADKVEDLIKPLDCNVKLRDGFGWARLWGGAALVLGVDDGQDSTMPLNVKAAKGIKFINVVDRRYINPVTYYEEALSPKFGLPKTYQVTPAFGGPQSATGANILVHETRLVRFWGTRIDPITTRRLAGWSYSVLQRPYDVIRMFASGFQAAGQLMYDAGQGVFKVTGLAQQMTGPNKNAILQRFANLDMQRWAGRILLVDKDGEDFDRKPVQISGVSDLLEHFEMRLAAAARMPVTLLMGRAPAGLDATGESDMRQWYDSVKSAQINTVEPALVKILDILTMGGWSADETNKVVWAGLEEPNDKDDAEVDKIEAETFQIYNAVGALSGEQIALMKFAKKSAEDVIDEDALAQVVEADYELAKNPPPTPPTGTVPPANGGLNGTGSGPKPPQGPPQKAPPPPGS